MPYGKFVLSNLAAKRAKQLREGALPLIPTSSIHPLTIAFEEIAAGKIKPIFHATSNNLVEPDVAVLIDENRPSELGLLLPSLDEVESALVSEIGMEGDDHEEHHEDGAEPVLSLSDLIEEEEPAVVADEEAPLSFTEMAEQESLEEEEEHEE